LQSQKYEQNSQENVMRGSFLVYTLIDAKLSDNMSAHHRDAFSFQSLSHYWFIFQISNENASPSWAAFVFLFFL